MNYALFNDAIGEIAPEIVERFAELDERYAARLARRKRLRMLVTRIGGVAAVLVLVSGLTALALSLGVPGEKPPTVTTGEPNVTEPLYHSPGDILTDLDPGSIVWGMSDAVSPGESEGESMNTEHDWDGTGINTIGPLNPDVIGYREWEGLYLDAPLYHTIAENDDRAIFAVGFFSLARPTVALRDYVYHGRTVYEIGQERSTVMETLTDLATLLELTSADLSAEELAEKLASVDEALVKRYYREDTFDEILLRDDLSAEETRYNALSEEYRAAVAAHRLEYGGLPDPNLLAGEGYYVVVHNGQVFLLARKDQLAKLSDLLLRHYGEGMLRDTFLYHATDDALGLSVEAEPYDPSQDRNEKA